MRLFILFGPKRCLGIWILSFLSPLLFSSFVSYPPVVSLRVVCFNFSSFRTLGPCVCDSQLCYFKTNTWKTILSKFYRMWLCSVLPFTINENLHRLIIIQLNIPHSLQTTDSAKIDYPKIVNRFVYLIIRSLLNIPTKLSSNLLIYTSGKNAVVPT